MQIASLFVGPGEIVDALRAGEVANDAIHVIPTVNATIDTVDHAAPIVNAATETLDHTSAIPTSIADAVQGITPFKGLTASDFSGPSDPKLLQISKIAAQDNIQATRTLRAALDQAGITGIDISQRHQHLSSASSAMVQGET